MKRLKKTVLYTLGSILIVVLSGCNLLSDNCYSEEPLLDVSDENPVSEYSEYYKEIIDSEAINLGIDLEQTIEFHEKYFEIIYSSDLYLISFAFNNSSGYYSYIYYFNENIDDLFQYDQHEQYIQFVAKVNELIVHKHQGDIDTYKDMYIDHLDHKADADYIYFSSSCNSRLGYSISVSDNYSETEDRWFISFKYHGLLEPVNHEE